MRVQRCHGADAIAAIREVPRAQGRCGHIFHSATKVIHRVLCVLRPCVTEPGDVREELHHVRGVGEGSINGVLLACRHHVPKWNAIPDILLDGDLPGDKGQEIGRVRLCHLPVSRAAAIFDRVADRDAIADHFPLCGDGGDGFGGRKVIWVIPSHRPLTVEAGLSLRPEAIFVGICLRRNHPVPAAIRSEAATLFGSAGVLCRDNSCRCGSQRRRQANDYKLTTTLKEDFLAIQEHSLNGQPLSNMELDC